MSMTTTISPRRLLLPCALLAVSFAATRVSAQQQQQQQVGYVLELRGQWFLGGSQQRLARGHALPAGGVVGVQSPTPDDSIVVVGPGGDIIARRDCRNPGECSRPIRLPRAAAPEPKAAPPKWRVVLSSVMGLLGGEPDRYSIHRKRDEELPDGVAQVRDGRLDLAPLFEEKRRGTYYLRLRPVPPEGKPAGKWMGPVTLDWDPAKTSHVAVEGLAHGLYELSLLDREGDDYLPAGASAWVLLSAPETYAPAAASYREAVGLTRKWGKDVTPEGARSFLRAQLDRLAAEARK